MITEREIRAAIDECHAVENPTADTCRKLASYYIIQDHLSGEPETERYSLAAEPERGGQYIYVDSSTDFAEAVNGRPADEIIPIVDELMTVLQAVNPRLYAGVMRKLRGE